MTCEHEHTAHKNEDSTMFWISCGFEKLIARAQFKRTPE